mmetsp:Transcript_13195/g.27873  ORF Transcript_13195/g.27873 Transcript_13195/m.27873 type:complete len:729 (-) Transcript_13195:1725-3911(-)
MKGGRSLLSDKRSCKPFSPPGSALARSRARHAAGLGASPSPAVSSRRFLASRRGHSRPRCKQQLFAQATDPPGVESVKALVIDFDNESDASATIVSIEGENQADLLVSVTGAFSALDLTVLDAMIKTEEGRVMDVFRVITGTGKQIEETEWGSVRDHILGACSASSRSNKPAIFGRAAESEETKQRPMMSVAAVEEELSNIENTATELEAAAKDMQQSAADLVRIEQELAETKKAASAVAVDGEGKLSSEAGVDAQQVMAQLSARAEAAAILERRMAAMEALLSGRRSPEGLSVEGPSSQRGGGAEGRFLVSGGTGTGPAAGSGYEIILQSFNWESCKHAWYKTLMEQSSEFAEAGFTALWLPPATDSVSPQGYLPRDLYCLDSQYGSEGELRELVKTIQSKGLKAVADIVINHRCAHYQDDQGRWNKFGGRLAWDKNAICSNNPQFGGTGNIDSGDDYEAAPNIDHTQEFVQKDLVEWLNYLKKSIGFNGWRFDYVKGYGGRFTRAYIDGSVPELAIGEFWDSCDYTEGVLDYNQDKHRQRTVDWCDQTGGTSAAFDFTTKGILQEAVGRNERWRLVDAEGRPPGMVGVWPSRAVLFIENHDTGSTLGHWPFPHHGLHEGYAYILTHPGTPCVFYDHYYQDEAGLRDAIMKLIRIRKRFGINSRSKVKISKAVAEVYAAVVDDKVAVKIGPGDYTPNAGGKNEWNLCCSGPNFAVWHKQGAIVFSNL